MKTGHFFTAILLLSLLAFPAIAAQTDPVLIDDFTVSAPTVDQGGSQTSTLTINGSTNAQRLIQTSGSGPVTAITNGDGLFRVAGDGGAFMGLSYSNFTLNGPEQNVLSLTFALTYNIDFLELEVQSSNSPNPIGGLYSVPDVAGPQVFNIDLTTLSGYSPSFMTGVNDLTLAFGSTQPIYQMQLAKVAIVPEPSVVSLFLMGAAGLVFLARRRQVAL